MKQIYFFVVFLLILSLLNGCSDLQKRAELGDARVEYDYAFYLQTEKRDLPNARHWYELSAKHGNQWAQNNLNLPPFAQVKIEPKIAKSNTNLVKHQGNDGTNNIDALIGLGILATGAYAIFGGSNDDSSDDYDPNCNTGYVNLACGMPQWLR